MAKSATEKAGKVVPWNWFGTLAAAHSENGDFELTVIEQRNAIEKLKAEKNTDAEDLKKAEARLALYLAKEPYRDA